MEILGNGIYEVLSQNGGTMKIIVTTESQKAGRYEVAGDSRPIEINDLPKMLRETRANKKLWAGMK